MKTIILLLILLIPIVNAEMSNSEYKIKDTILEPIETQEMSNTNYKAELAIEEKALTMSNSNFKLHIGYFFPSPTEPFITIIPKEEELGHPGGVIWGPGEDAGISEADIKKAIEVKKEALVCIEPTIPVEVRGQLKCLTPQQIKKERIISIIVNVIMITAVLSILTYSRRRRKRKEKKKKKIKEKKLLKEIEEKR